MKINLNDIVKVKLTDLGKDIYYHRYDRANEIIKSRGGKPITPKMPEVDEEGKTRIQLWEFIALYGEHIGMAKPNVIDPIELETEALGQEPRAGEMLICPDCGLEVHSDFKTCPRCGTKMTESEGGSKKMTNKEAIKILKRIIEVADTSDCGIKEIDGIDEEAINYAIQALMIVNEIEKAIEFHKLNEVPFDELSGFESFVIEQIKR